MQVKIEHFLRLKNYKPYFLGFKISLFKVKVSQAKSNAFFQKKIKNIFCKENGKRTYLKKPFDKGTVGKFLFKRCFFPISFWKKLVLKKSFFCREGFSPKKCIFAKKIFFEKTIFFKRKKLRFLFAKEYIYSKENLKNKSFLQKRNLEEEIP